MALPHIQSFFDPATHTVSHVLVDTATRHAAILDSVLDYDPKSGRSHTASADALIRYVQAEGLSVDWLLETHAHADHLSAAPYLQQHLGGRIAIGARIRDVQSLFGRLLNAPDMHQGGPFFDHLFADGETFVIGSLTVQVWYTPGHTPACVSYVVESAAGVDAFIGDTLFMPDYGSARCDFPGGDAPSLYRSVQKLLSLPADARLHLCHDYAPASRPPAWVCTVAEQRAHNIHLHAGISEAGFVALRTARDRTLDMPVLMWPAVQVNVRAGQFPPPEDNGRRYLKIPLSEDAAP